MTNERYMSRLTISSCLTREFVAMGRRTSRLVEAALDALDDVFGGNLAGSVFCVETESIFLEIGPAFGALWLNCECLECGSIS